ncbi:sulfite exporter TauE/SafE family protein [Simkania sp.]|uniref:sulfite exporter TauE/SafE family protein n=1 Tax=Simkania sp. TaxID=34094 RepID=UPI003B52AC38
MYFGIEIFGFIATGLAAGILAGLLGIGGGIVIIPCLILTFHFLKTPPDLVMHLAIGTSLAAMIFNSLSSVYSHYRKKGVIFDIVKPMALGVVVGSFLGAMIAKVLPGHLLQIIFGVFECLVGLKFLLPEKELKKTRKMPKFFGLSAISLSVSTISTMLGIGEGLINVPILTHYHVPMKKAIGTSSALSFLISLLGATYFLLLGAGSSDYPGTFGYIFLPAFIVISIVSFFTAPWGVKLAHSLPTDILRRVFGIVLIIAGIGMIAG